MRAVGLDLGKKNLGVAVSDSDGEIAVPHSTLTLTGNKKTDLRKVTEKMTGLISEQGVEVVVVGLPLGLNGQVGQAAEKAQEFVVSLEKKISVEVVLHDERFSTTEANKRLQGAGLSEKKSRSKVDMMAATIILQSWLDKNKNRISK